MRKTPVPMIPFTLRLDAATYSALDAVATHRHKQGFMMRLLQRELRRLGALAPEPEPDPILPLDAMSAETAAGPCGPRITPRPDPEPPFTPIGAQLETERAIAEASYLAVRS